MSYFENRVINKVEMADRFAFAKEQLEREKAYKNYKPKLTDEEFAKEWAKACQRVKEGLVSCQVKE